MLHFYSALYFGACSDDSSDDDGNAGSAGTGNAGAAGAGGSGGGAGSAGSAGAAGAAGAAGSGATGDTSLSFFVTSTGSGAEGGNLGGLDGADAKCDLLATAVGAGDKTWRAYLSTSTVNARDRIGDGPWFNADGDMVAADVASLHTNGLSNGDPQHMMDESGEAIPTNQHDIFTGSDSEGRLFLEDTCGNWTLSTGTPGPHVGHSDIPMNPMFSPSWNNAHTPPGCDQTSISNVGGAGRLYCFAE